MPGQELEPVPDQVAAVMGDVAPEVEDPEQIQRMIVSRILAADDIAGLFIQTGTIATKDAIGWPLVVRDIRLLQGEIDGEDTVYALIEALREDTGELIALNSGAPNILAILYGAKKKGLLPLQVEVAEAGKAKGGRNAPLTLRARGDAAKAIATAEAKR